MVKARGFKLHVTYSMLILLLQVCSIFYLAMHTNGTLIGFFRSTQREYSSKTLKHSIVERILVFKR